MYPTIQVYLIVMILGIPVDNQRLVLAGLRLEDDKTLADYNIRHGKNLERFKLA